MLQPHRDVTTLAERRPQRHEGDGAFRPAGRTAHGQSWLDLHEHAVAAAAEEPDLERRRNAGSCQIAVGDRERIERDDLHLMALLPEAEHLCQQ